MLISLLFSCESHVSYYENITVNIIHVHMCVPLYVHVKKSQFIAKYNYKDFVLLSPQRVAINGAIICTGP